MEARPLHPLEFGNILIVGAKASNFSEEIRTHPRVILWDSQNESWSGKSLPSNVRAVFVTRFIGHAQFDNLLREARNKKITMFNPEGTGAITRYVKELLTILPREIKYEETPKQETTVEPLKVQHVGKLSPLIPFIDTSLTKKKNAELLLVKARELNIQTTLASLANFAGVIRKKAGESTHKSPKQKSTPDSKLDITVQMLDNLISELKDMRNFLIATTAENKRLKDRLDRFKQLLRTDD
jgi:hypothetical protein